MKPLRFKVRKLYLRGSCPPEYFAQDGLVAYQLTPEGDYSEYYKFRERSENMILGQCGGDSYAEFGITCAGADCVKLWVCCSDPTMPFYISANRLDDFKVAVHEYNMKYCETEDMKGLDGFEEFLEDEGQIEMSEEAYKGIDFTKRKLKEYKATLSNPDMWFEEV